MLAYGLRCSWLCRSPGKATALQQYVGRLHRLHDNKRFVQVYDYVDNYVLMLARMYERRLKGYSAIGYVIEQEPFSPDPSMAARP